MGSCSTDEKPVPKPKDIPININKENTPLNNSKSLVENDNSSNISELLTAREFVRFNAKFDQPIEEMDKDKAYYQFLSINRYYDKYKTFPEGFFNWKDPNLGSKLEAQILKYNEHAELMNSFVTNKALFGYHPETMGAYVEILQFDDYIWQLLNRQLLIYKKF